jgi:hypothetical protein
MISDLGNYRYAEYPAIGVTVLAMPDFYQCRATIFLGEFAVFGLAKRYKQAVQMVVIFCKAENQDFGKEMSEWLTRPLAVAKYLHYNLWY